MLVWLDLFLYFSLDLDVLSFHYLLYPEHLYYLWISFLFYLSISFLHLLVYLVTLCHFSDKKRGDNLLTLVIDRYSLHCMTCIHLLLS